MRSHLKSYKTICHSILYRSHTKVTWNSPDTKKSPPPPTPGSLCHVFWILSSCLVIQFFTESEDNVHPTTCPRPTYCYYLSLTSPTYPLTLLISVLHLLLHQNCLTWVYSSLLHSPCHSQDTIPSLRCSHMFSHSLLCKVASLPGRMNTSAYMRV